MTTRRLFRTSLASLPPLLLLLLLAVTVPSPAACTKTPTHNCQLDKSLKSEIAGYRPVVERILRYVQDDHGYRARTWASLAEFTDTFGSRLAGTDNLEDAIDFVISKLRKAKLENVHAEQVEFTAWLRRDESALLVNPQVKNLAMLGLGNSVATPKEGIKAEVIVVSSFEELANKSSEVPGKIVVFNQPYVSYGVSVAYRTQGASVASKYGAVAALIRSVTPFSMYTPHTGHQTYAKGVKPIPAASITVEDAELLHRMYVRHQQSMAKPRFGIKPKKGGQLEILLKMNPKFVPESRSRNTIAEIEGETDPKKVVLVSGHLDSWDVGQGAMDDGGGAFVSWHSLAVLKRLELRSKRTIRCVLWTAEEEGLIGASAYLKAHQSELDKFNLVVESDEGTFKPYGIEFHGSEKASCIMFEVAKLFDSINATTMLPRKDFVGSDIELFQSQKVPGASLLNRNEKYFWYHHTEADTLEIEDPDSLDLNTAMFAAISYVIADLSVDLPRS